MKIQPLRKSCRICGDPIIPELMLAHAHKKHRIQWDNFISDRGGFGMSVYEHFRMPEQPDGRRKPLE